MIRTRHVLTASALLLVMALPSQAAEVTVIQKDKAFAEKEITVKAGDTINFVNEDTITHNVYSRSKGNKFDVGAQRPGTTVTQSFAQAGKAKVRCAIHPKMKMTVHVE